MNNTNKTGMWITEDFGTRFKLMAGVGQVLGFYDSYEQAKEARAAIAEADEASRCPVCLNIICCGNHRAA